MDNSKTRVLPYIVAVDFDGTLCEDAYPEIGAPKKGIIETIQAYKYAGWKTILWTCRNHEALDKAVAWCKKQGLEFDAINKNIPETQKLFGGDTRKVFADIYIDDKNVLLREVNSSGIRNNNTDRHN